MSNELKKCPHCGNKVTLSKGMGEWWVNCPCQIMSGNEQYYDFADELVVLDDDDDDDEEEIQEWLEED